MSVRISWYSPANVIVTVSIGETYPGSVVHDGGVIIRARGDDRTHRYLELVSQPTLDITIVYSDRSISVPPKINKNK